MNTLLQYTDQQDSEQSLSACLVKSVPKPVGRQFIKKHHYTGGCGKAAMTWGMYDQHSGELLGVIAFQTPISENVRRSIFGEGHENKVTELHRMAIKDAAPHNAGSWFISRTLDQLKDHKPHLKAVISFADATEGHDGTVYQAANADYYGTSRKTTYYRTPDGQLKAPRQVGENISLSEAKERGWEPERREAKHRYVFWLPDPYESKTDLQEQATIELEPYPSGE